MLALSEAILARTAAGVAGGGRGVLVPAIDNLGEPVHAGFELGLLAGVGGGLRRRGRLLRAGGLAVLAVNRASALRVSRAVASCTDADTGSPIAGPLTAAATATATAVILAQLGRLHAVAADGLQTVALDLAAAAGVARVRDAVSVDLAYVGIGSGALPGGRTEAEDVCRGGWAGVHCRVAVPGVPGVSRCGKGELRSASMFGG